MSLLRLAHMHWLVGARGMRCGYLIVKRDVAVQERFYDEAQLAKQHRYQFLPFGAGPRMCLGAGFAQVCRQEHALKRSCLMRDSARQGGNLPYDPFAEVGKNDSTCKSGTACLRSASTL